MNIEKDEKVLIEYLKLPDKTFSESIFNIAGYPNYENVCSNILQFYFNPFQEHSLGDLFLKSLFDLLGEDFLFISPKNINIIREYRTEKGCRIDLVMLTDDYVIGIENKMFHILNNDLANYKSTLNKIANDRKIIKIVLTLKKCKPSNGFISITYKSFLERIKSNLGLYTNTSNQKWLLFLLDFIHTIENFVGVNMKITEREEFLIKNDDVISELIQERNAFQSVLNKQIDKLSNIMEDALPLNCCRKWIYAKSCLVFDFRYGNN